MRKIEPGDVIGGRYEVLAILGGGGMKRVYRARDRQTAASVALAIVHEPEPRAFANEIELARRVESPHVARVLDGAVTSDGIAYVVTELCAGPDLRALVGPRGRLSWAEAALVAHQMSLGLSAVHDACVLHRDVKPDNAILTATGVKIIDFGVSEPARNRLTMADPLPVSGTLPYMAREVLAGVATDARSDVYALGITLFELLTGQLPLAPAGRAYDFIAALHALAAHDLSPLPPAAAPLRPLLGRMIAMRMEERPYMPAVAGELAALVPAGTRLPEVRTAGAEPRGWGTIVAAPTVLEPPAAMLVRRAVVPAPVGVTSLRPGEVVVTGWRAAPLALVLPAGPATIVIGLALDGSVAFRTSVGHRLSRALVHDLDGDGQGELVLWDRDACGIVDAGGKVRLVRTFERVYEAPPTGRVVAGLVLLGDDVVTLGPPAGGTVALPRRYEGDGSSLVTAAGHAGIAYHGGAWQGFRGRYATPGTILARPGEQGFRVALLEHGPRDIRTPVVVRFYGPGASRSGEGRVGGYDFCTAPWEVVEGFTRGDDPLFGAEEAPLSCAHRDGSLTVVVPYIRNAPWFGPVVVAFSVPDGKERWRRRLSPLLHGQERRLALLCDLGGEGAPVVLVPDGAELVALDAATGAVRTTAPITGDAIAYGDIEGRGRADLVVLAGGEIELWSGGPCPPGQIAWTGPRGDTWGSGHLLAAGHALGPRV